MAGIIARNGIVLLFSQPQIALSVFPMLRRIEPARPLIVVMEDIDELMSFGEHEILSLLDGEKQIDNFGEARLQLDKVSCYCLRST